MKIGGQKSNHLNPKSGAGISLKGHLSGEDFVLKKKGCHLDIPIFT